MNYDISFNDFPKYDGNSFKNKAALLYFDETQNVNVKAGLSFFEQCYVGNSRVDIRLEVNHNLIIPPFNHWTKIRQVEQ